MVGIDYAFLDGEDHDKNFPVMAMRNSNSKVIFSNAVPCKGTKHPYPVKQACFNLEQLGYKKIIFRSDQEPAIVDLCNKIKDSIDNEIIHSLRAFRRALFVLRSPFSMPAFRSVLRALCSMLLASSCLARFFLVFCVR